MEEKTYYFFPNKIKERQLETPGETTIKKKQNFPTSMKESKNSIYQAPTRL